MILFVLGLCMMMLFLGGISLDGWHALSDQRALAAAADSAAAAGASGIDTTRFANTGNLVLDPAVARELALANIGRQSGLPAFSQPPDIQVTAEQITVTLQASVHVTLLSLFAGNQSIPMTVTSRASPRPAS